MASTPLHLTVPERVGIDTADAGLLRAYLDRTYGTHFTIEAAERGCFCSHSRIDVGAYAVEEIWHSGDVRLRTEPMTSVVALQVLSGRVECRYGTLTATAGPGEWVLASTGLNSVRIHLQDAWLRSVVVTRPLLDEVSDDATCRSVIRFSGLMPTDRGMSDTLTTAERLVVGVLASGELPGTRLLRESAGRMLASAVLAAFPHESPADRAVAADGDRQPLSLRRAVDFIRQNAARNIGVDDIAAAVFLTPRSVQYMFRRYLGTTPTSYLREVRLTNTHHDLMAGDCGATTVAATAARWGFVHSGHFAGLYRNTYGESPHQTLRR
ncbi:AraC family transcriptional regulator [Mycobacterium sp. NPDC003323]